MSSQEFDTSLNSLPDCDPELRLSSVVFDTCPNSNLSLRVVRDNTHIFDRHGLVSDSWWVISCADLPDRTLRLFKGSHSLSHLLRRYGFLDSLGCVNHQKAIAHFTHRSVQLQTHTLAVPTHLIDAIGVPQFYPNSGVCWFAALCTVSFSNSRIRMFIESHMRHTIQTKMNDKLSVDIVNLCKTCLHDRDSAEELRKLLWYHFQCGDDVDDSPHNDGRNGFSEFTSLCAKVEIPLIRYKERKGVMEPMSCKVEDRKGNQCSITLPKTLREDHFLVFRFQDGDHNRFPVHRRMIHKGRRYNLVGVYAGQRYCGHQIGIACSSDGWRDMIIGDADLHKDGIGPVFVSFVGENWINKWWSAWKQLIHVTKFGLNSNFCNLNLHNMPNNSLDRFKLNTDTHSGKGNKERSNSLDVVYFTDTRSKCDTF